MGTARDEPVLAARGDGSLVSESAHSLATLRERARNLLHVQQERLRRFESDLGGRVQSLAEHYRVQQKAAHQREEALANQLDELALKLEASEDARSNMEETLDEARVALSRVSNEQRELHRQAVEAEQRLASREAEIAELHSRLAESGSAATAAEFEKLKTEHQILQTDLERLQAERDRWESERGELQVRLEEASSAAPDPAMEQELQTLQQRFETAVQEVRDLKFENERLCNRKAPRGEEKKPASDCVGSFDWEAQKERLLAQLESDLDDSDPKQRQDKLTVEGAIRITDQVVVEKELEIEELKALLKNQSENLGDVAVGAAAFSEILDNDELIRDERANLERLQAEWHEKLRKAEVDISVERAKIARERMELDEKIRALEEEQSQHDAANSGDNSTAGKQKSARGRWLTRLGLNDND